MSQTHCDVHGLPWKIVPAGVSKTTGNAYGAFTACPTMGCKQKPPLERPANLPPRTPMVPATPTVQNPAGNGYVASPTLVKEEPDWEKITEGKVRHGVVCAMLEAGRSKEEILMDYDMYTKLIITGSPI